MSGSRLLGTAAFALAVGFFFVPPVLGLAGLMRAVPKPHARLEVIPGDGTTTAVRGPARRTAAIGAPGCQSPAPSATPAVATTRSVVALAEVLD
jgi:hypothetical protein